VSGRWTGFTESSAEIIAAKSFENVDGIFLYYPLITFLYSPLMSSA